MAATIYYGGGEDTSFLQLVGTVSFLSDPSLYRSAWARVAVSITGAAAANPPPNRATSRKFIDKTNALILPANYWAHAVFAWGALGGDVVANCQMLRVLDKDGLPRIVVRGAASGAAKISTITTDGTITDLVTSGTSAVPIAGLVPVAVDLQVINAGTVVYGPRSDISFTGSSPGTISTASGNFAAAGLTVGSEFIVSGSSLNDGTYEATTASATSLVVNTATTLEIASSGTVDFTTSGLATLYFGAAPVAVFAGVIPTNTVTEMAQIEIANIGTGAPMYWSEVIVSDEPTLTKGLWTNPPQSAGSPQQWLPNTVANVGKVTINDATFVSTNANGQISNWELSPSAPPGGWMVDAVIQEARLLIDTTGPQHGAWAVNVNSTAESTGTISPGLTFDNFSYTWAENPTTSVDWAISDITANPISFGVESEA